MTNETNGSGAGEPDIADLVPTIEALRAEGHGWPAVARELADRHGLTRDGSRPLSGDQLRRRYERAVRDRDGDDGTAGSGGTPEAGVADPPTSSEQPSAEPAPPPAGTASDTAGTEEASDAPAQQTPAATTRHAHAKHVDRSTWARQPARPPWRLSGLRSWRHPKNVERRLRAAQYLTFIGFGGGALVWAAAIVVLALNAWGLA